MAVAVTRTDLSARDLRAAAVKTTDAKAARRMLAIALVLEDWTARPRPRAAGWTDRVCAIGFHRYQMPRGWRGWSNRRSAGPKPLLSADQKAELAQIVREGPDPAVDGVVRWACRPSAQDRGALRVQDA